MSILVLMLILGIETSCDETAAAVVEDGQRVLSNVVASSVDLHAAYGGVVPEIAARSHIESIIPVIEESLGAAKTDWNQIDAIAVTQGPGLLGSLVIGVMTAKTLATVKGLPLYAVDHVQAHVYGAFLSKKQPDFPLLALIISGGHTQLVLFKNHFDYKLLGRTSDDAIGEAFDKVAKMLGLPYPGGPTIGNIARKGNEGLIKFPTAKMQNPYDFSFSGLKTAVLRASQEIAGKDYTLPSTELPGLLSDQQKADLAASFQKTALQTVIDVLNKAAKEFFPASLVVAGGVAASPKLRELLAKQVSVPLFIPDFEFCTDNAAMIASNAYYQASNHLPTANLYKLDPDPGLEMQ